jgi:DNA-binding transcriptional regulator PaaX
MADTFRGIRKASEYRRGEIAKDILRLVHAGVLIGTYVTAPNVVQVIDMFNPEGVTERNRIWKAIKYLEEKNRIRIVYKGNERILTMTSDGHVALSEIAIDELAIPKPRWWDKKWRLVMFDIPVSHEKHRHPFRGKLEEMGYVQYQRSVFVHPYESRKEVFAIAEFYGVADHVRYLVVEEMTDVRELARRFGLI